MIEFLAGLIISLTISLVFLACIKEAKIKRGIKEFEPMEQGTITDTNLKNIPYIHNPPQYLNRVVMESKVKEHKKLVVDIIEDLAMAITHGKQGDYAKSKEFVEIRIGLTKRQEQNRIYKELDNLSCFGSKLLSIQEVKKIIYEQ